MNKLTSPHFKQPSVKRSMGSGWAPAMMPSSADIGGPDRQQQHSSLLQSNSAPSAKRILNFRQGISGANQLINRGLWRIGPQLYAVTDVACWLAGVTERARYFHFDILNIDPALGHLSVKIVAKARRQSRKQ